MVLSISQKGHQSYSFTHPFHSISCLCSGVTMGDHMEPMSGHNYLWALTISLYVQWTVCICHKKKVFTLKEVISSWAPGMCVDWVWDGKLTPGLVLLVSVELKVTAEKMEWGKRLNPSPSYSVMAILASVNTSFLFNPTYK